MSLVTLLKHSLQVTGSIRSSVDRERERERETLSTLSVLACTLSMPIVFFPVWIFSHSGEHRQSAGSWHSRDPQGTRPLCCCQQRGGGECLAQDIDPNKLWTCCTWLKQLKLLLLPLLFLVKPAITEFFFEHLETGSTTLTYHHIF